MNFWRGTAYSCGGLFENAPVQDPGQTHEGRRRAHHRSPAPAQHARRVPGARFLTGSEVRVFLNEAVCIHLHPLTQRRTLGRSTVGRVADGLSAKPGKAAPPALRSSSASGLPLLTGSASRFGAAAPAGAASCMLAAIAAARSASMSPPVATAGARAIAPPQRSKDKKELYLPHYPLLKDY
jgi:hypothetical protein